MSEIMIIIRISINNVYRVFHGFLDAYEKMSRRMKCQSVLRFFVSGATSPLLL